MKSTLIHHYVWFIIISVIRLYDDTVVQCGLQTIGHDDFLWQDELNAAADEVVLVCSLVLRVDWMQIAPTPVFCFCPDICRLLQDVVFVVCTLVYVTDLLIGNDVGKGRHNLYDKR